MDKKQPETSPTISDLYPHLDEREQKEVEETLDRYIEVVLEIIEDIDDNPSGHNDDFMLT